MTNKNPEIDIGVQPEDQKNKAAKPLESSYLYQGSDKQRGDPVLSVTADCSALHQSSPTPVSSCLIVLSPPSHATPAPTSLVLGLRGA